MTDPSKPTSLSETTVQRVAAALVQQNPGLQNASPDRLEQKAQDNLWAFMFAVPGIIVLVLWPAAMLYFKLALSWMTLAPMGLGGVFLVMGAAMGDKDVIVRLSGLVAIIKGIKDALSGK